ncbi:MAG: sigma-E factor negative regulatory protein [Gammaproteobacteria bacterium]
MEADVNRNIEEQLSAFLDGELPEAELQMLIRRLEKEENYRATLARYTLIGSIIRDDPAFAETDSVRTGVMKRLREVDSADAAKPDQPIESYSPKGDGSLNRRTGSLLVAAAAVLAVVGIYQFNLDVLPSVSVTSTPSVAVNLAAPVNPPVRAVSAPDVRSGRINADRITSYKVSHAGVSRSFQGAMVDSRVFVRPASYQE